MSKNDSINNYINQIELSFVKGETTLQLLMKLNIQLYLAELSLSNTISVLEIFGVERARSTVHNWVHKADLQPKAGRHPNHVVDETVIRFNGDQYWLYAVTRNLDFWLIHESLLS